MCMLMSTVYAQLRHHIETLINLQYLSSKVELDYNK